MTENDIANADYLRHIFIVMSSNKGGICVGAIYESHWLASTTDESKKDFLKFISDAGLFLVSHESADYGRKYASLRLTQIGADYYHLLLKL